jgi:hypothetical protein
VAEARLEARPEAVDLMKVYRDSEAEVNFGEYLEEAVEARFVVCFEVADHMEAHLYREVEDNSEAYHQ